MARFELLPPARHRRESLGERVDYTEVTPATKRALVCTVRRARGERGQSRRPERLLRAPRLPFQILELLRVARRVARVLAANNYAGSLIRLERFEETKALLLRTLPAARRTLGESHDLTLSMRSMYANVLYANPSATLDDLREAVETLEETEPIVRRILGGANPTLVPIVRALRAARAKLNAREPPNT